MRATRALVLALTLVIATAPAGLTQQPEPWIVPVLAPAPGAAVPSQSGKTQLLVIGDSLTRSMYSDLPLMLPGWNIGVNGGGGRPLAYGMGLLSSYELPRNGRTILAMSLFTNDNPRHVNALRAAVLESLRRVGPDGCAIWATIYRPANDYGIGYHAANQTLRNLAAENPNMRLVKWSETVRATRMPLRDDVHPGTRSAWDTRAWLFARAARSC